MRQVPRVSLLPPGEPDFISAIGSVVFYWCVTQITSYMFGILYWVSASPAAALPMTAAERETLETLERSRTAPHQQVLRAKAR